MKKFIVQTMLLLGFVLGYGFSYAQTSTANCPKKGTPDCPMVKNCSMKGTKDCPYGITASKVSKNTKANCPLAGTSDCPLEKCPLKGSPNCPLVKNTGNAFYAVYKPEVKIKEKILPPCCRKATN
jgi:hypothetical protein